MSLVLNSDVVQDAVNHSTTTATTIEQIPTEFVAEVSSSSAPSGDLADSSATTLVNSNTDAANLAPEDSVSTQNLTALESAPQVQGQDSELKVDETVYLQRDNGTENLNQYEEQRTEVTTNNETVIDMTIGTESNTEQTASTENWNVSQSALEVDEQTTDISTTAEPNSEEQNKAEEDHSNQSESKSEESSEEASAEAETSTQVNNESEEKVSQAAIETSVSLATAPLSDVQTLLDAIVAHRQGLQAAATTHTAIVQQLVDLVSQSIQERKEWRAFIKSRLERMDNERATTVNAVTSNQTTENRSQIQAMHDQRLDQVAPYISRILNGIDSNTMAHNATVTDLIQAIIEQQQVSFDTTLNEVKSTTATVENLTTASVSQGFSVQADVTPLANPDDITTAVEAAIVAEATQQAITELDPTTSAADASTVMTAMVEEQQSSVS